MSESALISYDLFMKQPDWRMGNVLLTTQSSHVERTLLTELVDINLHRLNKKEINLEKEYSYVELSSLSSELGMILSPQLVLGDSIPARGKLVARKGDVLLSTVRPERGLVAIVPPELDECIVSNGFAVLSPKENISSELLWCILRHPVVLEELQNMASGVTIPTIKLSQIKEYEVPVVIRDNELNFKAERLYGIWQKSNEHKRTLTEITDDVMVHELLESEEQPVQIDPNFLLSYNELHLKMRFDVDYFYNQLNQPKTKWNHEVYLTTLGDVVKVIRPSVDGINSTTLQVRIQDLDEESITINPDHLIALEDSKINDFQSLVTLHPGNILIPRVGGGIKKSSIVTQELEGVVAVKNHVLVYQASSRVYPQYLAYYLKSRWAQSELNVHGQSAMTIPSSVIQKVQIPLPSLEQQQRIVRLIEQEVAEQDTGRLVKQLDDFHKEIISN